MKKPKEEKKSWIVTMRCVVEKEIVTSECTKAEAEVNPYAFFDSETEVQQLDWDVTCVEPNE